MSKLKDPAGSIAERAIEVIRARGFARTNQIAEAIGVPAGYIAAHLSKRVKDGTLVTCKVQPGTGGPPQNEYRLSATGPMVNVVHNFSAVQAREPQPVRRPTIDAPSRLNLDAEESRTRSSVAPATVDQAPKPNPPREEAIHVNTSKPAATTPTPAFRCALANDGSLILFVPGQQGPIELATHDTRILIDYLRKLDQLSESQGSNIHLCGGAALLPAAPDETAPA